MISSVSDKVSCLMVTCGRLDRVRDSIAAFSQQDYENKELIIVSSGDFNEISAITNYRDKYSSFEIKIVRAPELIPLGAMRNIAVDNSTGKYICQWDDDDIHHPERLSIQQRYLHESGLQVCLLRDNFHFFSDTRDLYWCDWKRSNYNQGLPGSLFAIRSALPKYEPSLKKHEDARLLRLFEQNAMPFCVIARSGFLYTYVFHGTNTFDRSHHVNLVKQYALEASTLRQRRRIIMEQLDVLFGTGTEYEVIKVKDDEGRLVFTWPDKKMSNADEYSL